MGFSFMHLLLFAVIVGVIFGPKPFRKAGQGVGDFWRSLKRGYKGEEDIDITDTAKRIEERD